MIACAINERMQRKLGLHAGGSSGSQGDRRGAHWQRSALVQCGSASSAGRGRDPLFSKAFIAVLKAGGVKSVKIPAQSPNCNPYAERFVKTIKYECLNQFVIFGERHLRHLIKEFVEHYMTERFHQGIGGQLIRNVGPTNDNGADGKVACRSCLRGPAELLPSGGSMSLGDGFRDSKGLPSFIPRAGRETI